MNRAALILVLAAGTLFGLGLVISGMANPDRVQAFLRLGPSWDASLAWVMASALAVSAPGFAWIRRRGSPLHSGVLADPKGWPIDRPLVLGAAVFGAGWGLSGYCPGPAVIGAGLGVSGALWFVPAMLAGAAVARIVQRRTQP